MTFPTTANNLGRAVQSSDGVNTEIYTVPSSPAGYHLGPGLTPPQPATWINIPDGAFPLTPPGAPTTGPGTGFTGGGLNANGAYSWALSAVTDYGETPLGPQLIVPSVGSYTGYVLALPAVTEGTADNPVRKRRLYRTAAGGAQLKFVCEIGDLSLTTWRDAVPDVGLGDNAPTTNTSGVTGTVTLSGGGISVWTERSPTLAQASMASGDFVINRQTGNIVHAAADYARVGVQVQWSGSTLDTSSLVNAQNTAIRDIAAAVGAAGGVPSLNAQLQVVQAPAAGVRQRVTLVNAADVWLDSNHQASREAGNQSDYIALFTIPITTTGGDIELRFSGFPWNNTGQADWTAIGVSLDAGLVTQKDYAVASTANAAFDHAVHGEHLWTGVVAGVHMVHIMGQAGGPSGVAQVVGYLGASHPRTSPFHAIVFEVA